MKNVTLINATLGLTLIGFVAVSANANEVTPELSAIEKSSSIESDFSLKQFSYNELLSVFDIDNNGSLSQEELSTSDNEALKSAFKALDLNKDESISADEFGAMEMTK